MRVMGIDPGSRTTGFGIVDYNTNKLGYIASGCIKANPKLDYLARLPDILNGVEDIIRHYQPQAASIERAFVSHNPATALKLGQVRGLVLALCIQNDIPVYEFSARETKKLVTGQGNASKQQMQFMVQKLLNLDDKPAEDAADALSLAITYIQKS